MEDAFKTYVACYSLKGKESVWRVNETAVSPVQSSQTTAEKTSSAVDLYLLGEVARLKEEVAQLKNRNIIPIQNLKSKKLSLTKPIHANIQYEDNIYIVYSDELNLYGYGETEMNAIDDFCSDIEQTYFNLEKHKKNLGKMSADIFAFLKEVIIKQ